MFALLPPNSHRETPKCLGRGTEENLTYTPFPLKKIKSKLFYSFYQTLKVTEKPKERIVGESDI